MGMDDEIARMLYAKRATPEPCPTCKGRCCIDQDYRCRVLHMAAEFYEHVCDYCWDGNYEVRSEPEPAPKPVCTAEEERAAVVAWLDAREEELNAEGEAAQVEGHRTWAFDRASQAAHIANCIERGEHRREEER